MSLHLCCIDGPPDLALINFNAADNFLVNKDHWQLVIKVQVLPLL
jgi:hypothetical protein